MFLSINPWMHIFSDEAFAIEISSEKEKMTRDKQFLRLEIRYFESQQISFVSEETENRRHALCEWSFKLVKHCMRDFQFCPRL